jgi:hypothetical protein
LLSAAADVMLLIAVYAVIADIASSLRDKVRKVEVLVDPAGGAT